MTKSDSKTNINERWTIRTAVAVIRDVRKSKVVTQDSERERRIRIARVVESALVELEKENDY